MDLVQIWLIPSCGQLVQNLESPDRVLHPIGSRGTKLIRIISQTEPNQSLDLLIGFLRFLRKKRKVTFSKSWSYLSNPKCFNFCLFCSVLLYKIYIQYFEILFFFLIIRFWNSFDMICCFLIQCQFHLLLIFYHQGLSFDSMSTSICFYHQG